MKDWNYKITREQAFQAYARNDRGEKLKDLANQWGVKFSYLQSVIHKQALKDDYLMQDTTPLSACGGLSIEARQ